MREYLIWHHGSDERTAETFKAYDALGAAIDFVAALEARQASYDVAGCRKTMRLNVRGAASGQTYNVEVFGDPTPHYDAKILGGTSPIRREETKEGTRR